MPRRHDKYRLTAEEFRVYMHELSISSTRKLGDILNVNFSVADRWQNGENDIPHYIRVLFETWLAYPGAFELAYALARQYHVPQEDEEDGPA